MATLTFTISDATIQRPVKALSALKGQDPTLANAKQAIIDYIVGTTKQYEAVQAQIAANASLPADVSIT